MCEPVPSPDRDRSPGPPRVNPYLEQAVLGLRVVQDACATFTEDHIDGDGFECDCLECEDARGILYVARQCEVTLTSNMFPSDKLRRLRARDFPNLADLLLSRHDSDNAQEEDSHE